MAVCKFCDREMTLSVPCTLSTYDDFNDGVTRMRIAYGAPGEGWEEMSRKVPDIVSPMDDGHHCHDCGTPPGGFHHPGCDMERCPKCGEQAIACDCSRPQCPKCGFVMDEDEGCEWCAELEGAE